jgi:uncharacterized protein YqeY
MSIHLDIKEEMKDAIRVRDRERLTALRSMIAEFNNEIIARGGEREKPLSDEEAQEIIIRLVKQRRDSIEQFEGAGRDDLAQTERQELSVLEKYLPEQMTEDDIEKFLKEKIKELKITDSSKIGQLLGLTMKELRGKVDGRAVKRIAEKLLPSDN